jgi:hypothetical protein
MKSRILVSWMLLAGLLGTGPVWAGDCCTPSAASMVAVPQAAAGYRLEYRTQYEPQQVTAYRIEYETVYEDRPVISYRPVWETQMREYSYDRVTYVQETAEREEQHTVYQPVYETQEREQWQTVMRPTVQTVYRTQYTTAYEPVTSSYSRYVDQGSFTDQLVFRQPAIFRNRLAWQPAQTVFDPVTGAAVQQPAGLYWVPRGRYEVQRVYQPALVPQTVTQTTYMPRLVQQQVPVEVTTYQAEQVCQRVPVQVCRMVPQVVTQKTPYTVSRPVPERISYQVPVRVCKMEAVQETQRVARVVEKRVPVAYACTVPRVVCYQVPVDACGVPIGVGVPASVPGAQPTPALPNGDAANERPRLPFPKPLDSEAGAKGTQDAMKAIPGASQGASSVPKPGDEKGKPSVATPPSKPAEDPYPPAKKA